MWKVEYNDELKIIQTTMSGEFSDADILECASERIALGKEKGVTKFIIDAIDMQLSGSTLAIYDVPAYIYPRNRMPRITRIAVLSSDSSSSKPIVQFFENVSINRGWNAKIFNDHESAIEWLQKP